jgi:cephalosporin-C deacetylase-like acetyl esterase
MGRESRETYYFRRVFLSFVRVIDFLTSQPDWDGKHMIVYGSSQGGGSTLAAAGLDPRVTCAAANVPALCDHLGLLIGRPSGWPKIVPSPDAKAELVTAQYFDGVNFARHITCPIMVSVGLRDTTCPATTGLAAYNAIAHDQKRMMIFPTMGHAIDPEWNKAVAEFFTAHVKGEG